MNETAEISRQEAKKMEMLLFLRATMPSLVFFGGRSKEGN